MTVRDIRHSEISTFLDCKKKYYYSFIRNLELKSFNPNFSIGTAFHDMLHILYATKKVSSDDIKILFEDVRNDLRLKMIMNPINEDIISKQESITLGMVKAYQIKYSETINSLFVNQNELELRYLIMPNVNIVIHIDNILFDKNTKNMYLHEIKTTQSINSEYVRNVQHSLQASMYFHIYNRLHENKLHSLMYDIIQKPSIRLTKTETPLAFLERLLQYYAKDDGTELFSMELIQRPVLTDKKIFDALENIVKDMLNAEITNEYYCNYKICSLRSKCDFFDLCMHGESPITLISYRSRCIHESVIEHVVGKQFVLKCDNCLKVIKRAYKSSKGENNGIANKINKK